MIEFRPLAAEDFPLVEQWLRSEHVGRWWRDDIAESLAEYRVGHELGSKRTSWRYPSADWVAKAERLAALADRIPGLGRDAPRVVERLFPECSALYAAKGWRLFPRLDRVYVNERARSGLGWQPKYDFAHVLRSLRDGTDFRSPLAREVGVKGYHGEEFRDGLYPVV